MIASVGDSANVTCNTGYYLRQEGDGGGVTTCSETCLLAIPKCTPVVCAGTGIPIANSSVQGGHSTFTYPNV
jgi:hypothetical protein